MKFCIGRPPEGTIFSRGRGATGQSQRGRRKRRKGGDGPSGGTPQREAQTGGPPRQSDNYPQRATSRGTIRRSRRSPRDSRLPRSPWCFRGELGQPPEAPHKITLPPEAPPEGSPHHRRGTPEQGRDRPQRQARGGTTEGESHRGPGGPSADRIKRRQTPEGRCPTWQRGMRNTRGATKCVWVGGGTTSEPTGAYLN